MKKLKKWLPDVGIIAIDLLIVAFFGIDALGILLIAAFSFLLHCSIFCLNQKHEIYIEEEAKKLIPNVTEDEYTKLYRELEYTQRSGKHKNTISIFLEAVEKFSKKEEALKQLVELNGGRAGSFLTERSMATKEFIVQEMKKLMKCIIVYDAQSEENHTARFDEDETVMTIFEEMDTLTDLYDQLLKEVSIMGSNFDADNPDLQNVIENIRKLRIKDESEPDDGEIHLTLESTTRRESNE